MNKVTYYTANENELSSVSFKVIRDGIILNTLIGIKNESNVWESVFPNLPPGRYTIVAFSGVITLGNENIYWSGTDIIEDNSGVLNGMESIVRSAVRTELTSELTHLISLQNGLTEEQSLKLAELYFLMGLDATKPLVVTKTSRYVENSSINQQIQDSPQQTKVTRNI